MLKKKICILFQENGIGDYICALPALWQKIQDGYDVVLYGDLFFAPIFEKLGIEVRDGAENFQVLGSIEKLEREFSKVYSLTNYCLKHEHSPIVFKTRFEQMAEYIETTVPAVFDFKSLLFPNAPEPNREKVLLATWSRSKQRAYPHTEDVFESLSSFWDVECVGLFMQQRETLENLIAKIYNSKLVISIDTGILHLALALGAPVLALMGGSDETIIVYQYGKYRSLENINVLRSESNDECSRPCSFHPAKGYGVNGKCDKHIDCMEEISPLDIFERVNEMIGEKNTFLPDLAKGMFTSEKEKEDSDVIEEVIEKDCYELLSLKKKDFKPEVIFDIGSHIGSFTVLAHSLFPEAKCFTFEPNERNFSVLKKNAPFAENYNCAIDYSGEELVLTEGEGSTGGGFTSPISDVNTLSERKHSHDGWEYSALEQAVKSLTIEEVFSAHELKSIDLLKLDCEGAEWGIVENISPEIAKTVKCIRGEYHTFNGRTVKEFMIMLMEKFHHLNFTYSDGTHGIFESIFI